MPELPEVRTTSKTINKVVSGKRIIDIKVFNEKLIKEIPAKDFIKAVKGKKILSVSNIGKFIVFFLEKNVVILSHMRMEGKYRAQSKNNPLRKHDYLIFVFKNFNLIYNDTRLFGTFHLRTKQNYLEVKPLSLLAKEPININLENLYKKLQKKSVAIKTALLDQRLILGLGNIYANETLFYAKINPLRKCNEITKKELKNILRHAHDIMERSTKAGGSTIKSYVSFNDKVGLFQRELLIHGKENLNCSKCNTKILKIKINGRGTYYCPKCQKN